MCLPSLLSYASLSSASWVNKKSAKSYSGHIASRHLAVNIGFEMKSLIVLLFLGAVVLTLAENAFQDEAVQEYLDGETFAELADEMGSTSTARLPILPAKIALVRSPPLSPFLNRLQGWGELT